MTVDRVLPMSLEINDQIILNGQVYLVSEIDESGDGYTLTLQDDKDLFHSVNVPDNKMITLLL
jgi:hypothetical protein